MKRIIILVVFILSFNLSYSQISREKAYEIVKESVLGNNWNDYEILLMKSTLSANSVISAIDTSIVSPNYQSWFFFIDMDPSAEWMHSCKYVFISVS